MTIRGSAALALGVLGLAAAIFVACTPAAPRTGAGAPAAAPPPIDKVRIGALSSASDSGIWIAVAKKYFEQERIELEVTTFASAAEMVAPLGAGQLDVGAGAPGVGLSQAVLRGIELKIVADKGNISPGNGYQGILARKDLYESGQVTGPGDLKVGGSRTPAPRGSPARPCSIGTWSGPD